MDYRKIFCAVGIHSWGSKTIHPSIGSNVTDYSQACKVCGKTKRWVE
ncbi:MAG: hypothetical protein HYT71_00175 [Candidatus Aenigmarchaeota archaeon]|nr:hypothetical protein [Candidatus Aenigmarchaeota archaeon]